MPNFTNKVKLKKPLGTEYFNINDMNENMDKIEEEFYTPKYSEDLLNENITSFKVGTGKANGVAKDYTDKMEQSLVSIDNVEGYSRVKNYNIISKNIGSITVLGEFVGRIDLTKPYNINPGTTVTYEGTSVKVKSDMDNTFAHCSYLMDIEPNCEYTVVMHAEPITGTPHLNIILNNDGGSNPNDQLDVTNLVMRDSSDYYETGKFRKIIATFNSLNYKKLNLHTYANASDGFRGNMEVKYNSISIYTNSKVVYPNGNGGLELRSLPNGVCDIAKDGRLTKRVSNKIMLSDLKWQASVTNVNDSNYTHYVYYAFPIGMKKPKDLYDDDQFILCNCLDSKPHEFTASASYDKYSINCISGHSERSEVRVKISKSIAPTLADFINWTKGGAHFQYELDDYDISDVNTSIDVNSGDTIQIDTPIPLSCTHKVQLNTKAQIEELHKVVQKEKKSIWKNIKELTDCNYSTSENGYIKLPTILGGLIIQWGGLYYKDLNWNTINYKEITLPITFNTCYSTLVGVHGHSRIGDSGVATVMKTSEDAYTTSSMQIGINPGSSGWCGIKYIAIGK